MYINTIMAIFFIITIIYLYTLHLGSRLFEVKGQKDLDHDSLVAATFNFYYMVAFC